MSERFHDQDPQVAIAEQAKEQISRIEIAVVQIGGEGAELDEVFPQPPEVRDDALDPDWDEQQEAVARNLAESLGYASEKNVHSGLRGGVFLGEGGKVWKMESEAEAQADEEDLHSVVMSGSPYRLIGDDEKAHKVAKFKKQLPAGMSEDEVASQVDEYEKSLEGFTEYDEAVEIAQSMVVGPVEKEVLPYGYEISEGNPFVSEATGQFVKLGQNADGKDVITMRVDREVMPETDKYQYQPDPMRRMGIISDILKETGDNQTPVIFGTSNAYASRKVDAIRAGLDNGRQYGVAMYGRATLAEVKDEPMQPGARLNQLPGDIRQTHDKLQQLLAEIGS